MVTRLLASCLAALTLTVAAAPPPVARACGDTHQTATSIVGRAGAVVEAHFAALAAGDARAVRKLWARDAKVVSESGGGSRATRSIRKALKRWLGERDGLRWEVISVEPTDQGAEVRATVTWNGATYDDVLQVAYRGERLLLVGKVSTARAEDQVRY